MNGKLYRSRTDCMVGGVCGGLGAYLGVDPGLVRLFFILLTIGGGAGVPIYLILWVLMPAEPEGAFGAEATIRANASEIAERARTLGGDIRSGARQGNPQAALVVGVALVLFGFVFLAQSLNIVWLRWLDFDTIWPILLIGAGAALIWRRLKGAGV